MSKVKFTRRLLLIAGLLTFAGGGLAAPQSPQQQPQRPIGDPRDQNPNRPQTQPLPDQRAEQTRSTVENENQRFLKEAVDAGTAEVAFGRLAAQKASSDDVKQFAQRMVDDHAKANQELTQLAAEKGVVLPQSKEMSSSSASTSSTGTASDQQRTPEISKNQQAGTAPAQSPNENQLQGKHKGSLDRLTRLSGAEFDREYMKLQLKNHDKAVNLFQKQAEKGKDADVKAWASKTLPTLREHQQNARQIASAVGVTDKSTNAYDSKKGTTSSGRP